MPRLNVKTGIMGTDGHEEVLSEYFCDWPGCQNVAEHVLGCVKEIGVCAAVCSEHLAKMGRESNSVENRD